jgi:putative ABC transport system permease protein
MVYRTVVRERLLALLAGFFALVGLVLTAVGLYGTLSYAVVQRTREIGIRVALGARPGDVLRLIVGQGVQLVVIGILVGLALSAAMSRVLSQFLPLVDAGDWITFGSVALGLAALSLLACYVPARRATRVPVMTALRYE